jgi:hypothetical protein
MDFLHRQIRQIPQPCEIGPLQDARAGIEDAQSADAGAVT